MQEPTTQEEIDRKDSKSTSVGITQDILGLLDGMQRESSKLKALKILLPTVVNDSEIMAIIEEEIELAEKEEGGFEEEEPSGDEDLDLGFGSGSGIHTSGGGDDFDFGDEDFGDEEGDLDLGGDLDTGGEEGATDSLPTPDELGAGDFTDNGMEI